VTDDFLIGNQPAKRPLDFFAASTDTGIVPELTVGWDRDGPVQQKAVYLVHDDAICHISSSCKVRWKIN
jgi:hypothetical protein